MAALTNIEIAEHVKILEKYRQDIVQAQKTLNKFEGMQDRFEYRQALGEVSYAQDQINKENARFASLGALTAPQTAYIEKKQDIVQAQAEGLIRGPTSSREAITQEVQNMPTPSTTPSFIAGLPPGLGLATSLALQASYKAAQNVPTPAGTPSLVSKARQLISSNPIAAVSAAAAAGLVGGGVAGYFVGKSRATNPRTGKPYRRMNPQNNKALGRAVRRINAYTKANNRVEKALRAAARSAK